VVQGWRNQRGLLSRVTQYLKTAGARHMALPVDLMELACSTGALTRGFLAHNMAKHILAADIFRDTFGRAVRWVRRSNVRQRFRKQRP
jgi:hypothetical protein